MIGDSSGETVRTEPIASEVIRCERKHFFLDLSENQRGRYLKIAEKGNGGRREMILLPVEAFVEFTEAVRRLVDVAGELGTEGEVQP